MPLPDEMPDIQRYFRDEAARLNKLQPGLSRTIQNGDKLETETADSTDWLKEFESFLLIDPSLEKYANAFEKSVDSGRDIVIIRFIARDTNTDIQEISMTRRKARMELLEIKTKERSWAADRDRWLSYQPGRGYRIVVREDYFWSSPGTTEIFATFNNAEF